MQRLKYLLIGFPLCIIWGNSFLVRGQTDTAKLSVERFILKQKGFMGKLAKNLLADTLVPDKLGISTDKRFQPFNGKIIRNILVLTQEFGLVASDSNNKLKNTLKKLSNTFHHRTRDFVIRKNLFFSEHDKLSSFVLADNERHLRDLPFIRDAYIGVLPVRGSTDSVDIVVFSNDVLTIGGSFRMHNTKSISVGLKEENLFRNGDRIVGETLFDNMRTQKFGYGLEYISRNIAGTFIDGTLVYTNAARTYSNGSREEQIAYLRFVKPLISRNMKWTYGADLEWHKTQNFYNPDSTYKYDLKYSYNFIDAWASCNIDAAKPENRNSRARTRRLLGLRVLQQNFMDKPLRYSNQYFYNYADFKAVLASVSIFRQLFYKTQYIYGFGRNEDVPEGIEASIVSGYTKRNERVRPYAGINFQRYHFTAKQHYFNYSISTGTYVYQGKMEDVDLLAKFDYFSRLYHPEGKWKRRFFLNTSVARQFNFLLSEPLRPGKDFSPENITSNFFGGHTRVTAKAESVFFSPWSVLFFRFAPFLFGEATYINWDNENALSLPKFNMALGGGMRIRNENLIFGTTEVRGILFPRKNFSNERWRVEVSTNIRFKYNQEYIRRPELIKMN